MANAEQSAKCLGANWLAKDHLPMQLLATAWQASLFEQLAHLRDHAARTGLCFYVRRAALLSASSLCSWWMEARRLSKAGIRWENLRKQLVRFFSAKREHLQTLWHKRGRNTLSLWVSGTWRWALSLGLGTEPELPCEVLEVKSTKPVLAGPHSSSDSSRTADGGMALHTKHSRVFSTPCCSG